MINTSQVKKNKRNSFHGFVWTVRWLLLVVMANGCSISHTSPDTLLNRALDGMAGKDQFRFQGMAEILTGKDKLLAKQLCYDGEIQQHKGIHMRISPQAEHTTTERWNPLKQLEELRVMGRKRVKLLTTANLAVQSPSHLALTSCMRQMNMDKKQKRELLPLQVDVDAVQAKRMYAKQLNNDYTRLIASNLEQQQMKSSLSQADREGLYKKLNNIAMQGRKELQEKLRHASVQAKYVVWVHKRNSLPAYVEGWVTVSYLERGRPQEELVRMQSRFQYE